MPGLDQIGSDVTQIKDLKTGMRNITVHVIFLEINPRTATSKEGVEIRTCKVADRSACINFTIMGSDVGCYIQPGDICRITKCYVSLYKGIPTLYMAKGGTLLKVAEFSMVFHEGLNMSEPVANTAVSSTPATANQGSGSVSVVEID